MQYNKVKSVAKRMEAKGSPLAKKILDTMKTISDLVGATLGPGGCPVIIERQELNMPGMITKDGVTVFRSMGFDDPVAHVIMEAARDASVRTANEAGDGTTTATVLAEAIVRKTAEFCKAHPKVSPQKVVRALEGAFHAAIEPAVRGWAVKADLTTDAGRKLLHSVASISANGDTALADAVMECYDLVGDNGNVTIVEASGDQRYEVEAIDGYPVGMGYDESCARYWPMFITDQGTQKVVLDDCLFVLYHGRVTDPQVVSRTLEMVAQAWDDKAIKQRNVILVATGFSDNTLALLGQNFVMSHTINVFPLLVPQSPIHNGQLAFIEDVQAITGAKVFDPINHPLDTATLNDFGLGGVSFEAGRFRSTIVSAQDEQSKLALEGRILNRVGVLQQQLADAGSQLETVLLQERIGKITGGIAKLKVIGTSNGDLREKRDRAEDAVCAVRGALKHGCLPGGGWTLLHLMMRINEIAGFQTAENHDILMDVLVPALKVPVTKLLTNCGLNEEEADAVILKLYKTGTDEKFVYDAAASKFGDAFALGVLDSTPAVLEAIRNSISIASLLGTLGGAVVFKRDLELERVEARETAEFTRNAEYNPANEHG